MPSTCTFDVDDRSLETAPIRGRADELSKVGALVTAVAQGRGGVLVIDGPPGIGKSRLLTEVLALAENTQVRTLFGEAFEYQQSVPFFSLFMATLRADPPVGDFDALRQHDNSADLSYWVVHNLARAIQAAAAQTPLVIVLEDIHWADTGTLVALRSLVTACPNAPVLWVLTSRTGAGGPAVHETLAVLHRANATFLRVAAMSPGAVAEMVQDAVRAKADESLLSLAAKAHGNPFLVRELLGGLREEGRLAVSGGRAEVTGDGLPHRMSLCMQQRLDLLSRDASELVRVAAVLPDRFSARLLAAMLERQPSALMSALAETVRGGLLVEDGDQLRFAHDLLRDATRQSLPQSLRRAIERQSASVMLSMGAAPAEVANQLARSAEPGDREAIDALRQAAQAVSQSDASAAADLSKHALDLMPDDDAEHGRVVGETVGLLNRARRYEESEELAVEALARASDEEEAVIRLRLPAFTRHTTQRRIEENRRALELRDIDEVTRARHVALLAYNLMLDDKDGQHRAAAEEAARAADAIGDLESKVVANLTLSCFDCADGHAGRAIGNLEELCALGRTSDLPVAHLLATNYYANLLALVGRLDEAAEQVSSGVELAKRESNAMVLDVWATIDGMVHLAAGRLPAARAAVESLAPPDPSGATELDMVRMVILVQVAASTDDRNLLQQMVSHALDAYATGASMVRRTAAYVLALAAWHRNDFHDAMRWFGDDIRLLGTPLTPQALDQVLLAARVASAAGDAGCRARVLRAVQKLQHDETEIPLFAAVAVYVRGILECDAEALVSAAEMLRSSSRPLLYAAAAEDAGRELVLADRREEALEHLNAAFDTYSRLEALTDARRVGRELRGIGVERRIVTQQRVKTGWGSLTDAELKVVSVIAQGATNRAVADQLHLSLHTVKTHVHNAFAKLSISSRSELTDVMR
jgi:DNA-binding CsgD family transcriptional regulator/tetratricopeptide (TPR) repeat protein